MEMKKLTSFNTSDLSLKHDKRDAALTIGVVIAAVTSFTIADTFILVSYLLFSAETNVFNALKETILIQVFVNELILLFWFYVSYKHLFKKSPLYFYGKLKKISREALIGLAVGITGFFIAIIVAAVVENTTGFETPPYFLKAFKPTSFLFLILWILLIWSLVSPAEELFFRGLVQTVFTGWKGGAVGIAVSSVLFGLAHFSPDVWPKSIVAFVIGLIYGLVFHKRKNVLACWVAHGINDSLAFSLLFSTGF